MANRITINTTGNVDVLQLTEQPKPVPAANQVLVRNHAAAVNFIDTIIRRGEMPPGMMPELPHTPGVEGAGIVEQIGEAAAGLEVGDRVAWMGTIGSGGYATYSCIDENYVVKLDQSIDFSNAAALPVNAMTAWHMLVNLGQLKTNQTVLVHAAAGGVGTMATHIAKHLGMTVIASASNEKLDYCLNQGADFVIDYRQQQVSERVLEFTDGRGVDLSLNPIAGETLKDDLQALAPLGTSVIFGFLAGPPAGSFAEDMTQHFNKSIAVRVSDIYTYYNHDPAGFNRDLNHVFTLLKDGTLNPQLFATIELKNAADAHSKLESGQVAGKIVLSI